MAAAQRLGAVLIGGFILAIALALGVILGVIVYIRMWWLRRKFARSGKAPGTGHRGAANDEVIEVEYTVVSERDDGDRPGRGQ